MYFIRPSEWSISRNEIQFSNMTKVKIEFRLEIIINSIEDLSKFDFR